MFTRLFSIALACTLLLQAEYATAAKPRRGAVLLLPLDRNAFARATEFGSHIEDAMQRNSRYVVRSTERLLGDSTPNAALEARKRLAGAVREAKKQFVEGNYDEAEASLRTGLGDAEPAVAAMDSCSEYCDALAHLAAVQLMKGEEIGAQEALKSLLAADPNHRIDGPAFGKTFQVLLRDTQKELLRSGLLGNLRVESSPPGGRVYLDGKDQGYAPLTIQSISAGKHMLRIERGGSITFGQLVEVAGGGDTVVRPRLTPTPEYAELEAALDSVAEELEMGETGKSLMSLGGKLKVDRAIVGTVRTSGQRVTLDCVLVDFARNRKLAGKRQVFQGDEYGELEKEIVRYANMLLALGDRGGRSLETENTGDPLDSTSGMEDWDQDYSGDGPEEEPEPVKTKPKKKKKGTNNDPLDEGRTGTDDW